MRNKKKQPLSSTENSKDFDSTKKKREPPMTEKILIMVMLILTPNKQLHTIIFDSVTEKEKRELKKLFHGKNGGTLF